jgi:predicted RNase H-like nuclease (RuvC/YqgF family)
MSPGLYLTLVTGILVAGISANSRISPFSDKTMLTSEVTWSSRPHATEVESRANLEKQIQFADHLSNWNKSFLRVPRSTTKYQRTNINQRDIAKLQAKPEFDLRSHVDTFEDLLAPKVEDLMSENSELKRVMENQKELIRSMNRRLEELKRHANRDRFR